MDKLIDWFLFLCTLIIVGIVAYNEGWRRVDEVEPERVVVDHYLTDLIVDTVYLDHFDTITLHKISVDTAFCTLSDSVMVEVPINKYIYDTIVNQGDSVETQIKAQISGFNVCLDTIFIHTDIMQYKPNKKPSRWCIGAYAGYGVNKDGISPQIGLGVMYRLL